MSGNRKSAAERRADRAAANSRGTAANPIPGNRPWVKGQSGNPSGRPKGIAAAVRSRIDARGGPDALADALLEELDNPRLKPMERVSIIRELWDRGYGKAPAFAAIEGTDPLELDAIAAEIQGIADELKARRDAREPATGTGSQTATG